MSNKDKRKLLESFIEDNNLSFEDGCRNQDSVVLAGFALHLGLKTLPTIVEAVENKCDPDDGWEEELERVFVYAKNNNYGAYWSTRDAVERYTF